VSFSPQPAGLSLQTGHHGPDPDPVALRPISNGWASDELIVETRRVWSAAYGRVISIEEAMEILANVRRLAEVLIRANAEAEES